MEGAARPRGVWAVGHWLTRDGVHEQRVEVEVGDDGAQRLVELAVKEQGRSRLLTGAVGSHAESDLENVVTRRGLRHGSSRVWFTRMWNSAVT